jgi:predicted ribosome-associated RNA-binding protein Tma20
MVVEYVCPLVALGRMDEVRIDSGAATFIVTGTVMGPGTPVTLVIFRTIEPE